MPPAPTAVPRFTRADRLRKAREARQLTQDELAEQTGISRRAIQQAERGQVIPRQVAMQRWADATGVPVEWIETGRTPEQLTAAGR